MANVENRVFFKLNVIFFYLEKGITTKWVFLKAHGIQLFIEMTFETR